MTETYPFPVSQLLTLGETQIHGSRSYLKMGLTREHIPDLIRLVEDEDMHYLEWNEDGEYFIKNNRDDESRHPCNLLFGSLAILIFRF